MLKNKAALLKFLFSVDEVGLISRKTRVLRMSGDSLTAIPMIQCTNGGYWTGGDITLFSVCSALLGLSIGLVLARYLHMRGKLFRDHKVCTEAEAVEFKPRKSTPCEYAHLSGPVQHFCETQGWFLFHPGNNELVEMEDVLKMIASVSYVAAEALNLHKMMMFSMNTPSNELETEILTELANCRSTAQAAEFIAKHGRPSFLNRLMGDTYQRRAVSESAGHSELI